MRSPIRIEAGSGQIEKTYLWQYRELIRSGKIIAGIELITELDRLIDDIKNGSYIYDTREADRRMDFMENCIRLTKSPFYGKPMQLLFWEKAFIEAIYSFKMPDQTRRIQRVDLLIPRKNGKSEICSGLLDAEFFIGGTGLDIICSSNDDRQADIVFAACDTMRQMIDPKSKDSWRNQKGLKCFNNNNQIKKISDRTRNKEGLNIDIAVVDEVHEMKDNVIVKSIEQSQSVKDNPLLIIITTEGFVNDGFLDGELERCRGIINGEIQDLAAQRTTAWLYTQDDEREVWDGNRENRLWEKSNPSLGIIKKYSYMEQQVDVAKTKNSERAFVLTKDFNIKQATSQAWLLKEDYDYEYEDFAPEMFRGRYAIGGVDIAETTDLSAVRLLMMLPEDNKKYMLSHYFIPEGKLERANDKNGGARYEEWGEKGLLTIAEGDNYIDTTIIADWIYEQFALYGIKTTVCGYDQKFSKEFLERMDDYGIDCEMIYQRPEIMHLPMDMVEADLKSRLIVGNNEIDKWCLSNVAQKFDAKGKGMAVKIGGQAEKRIDGAIATIITYETYRRHRSEYEEAVGAGG